MYPNLKAEMARRGITASSLAEMTEIPYSTLAPKLRGERPITVREAQIIKTAIGTDVPLDLLFDTEI
jgi:transcriptional regulator with XRE-family HTH domain